MTDNEIEMKAEEIWKVKNSWGLSYMDFIMLSYKRNQRNENEDKGDVVYISENGGQLTRGMAISWSEHWHDFLQGFQCAIKYIEEISNLKEI